MIYQETVLSEGSLYRVSEYCHVFMMAASIFCCGATTALRQCLATKNSVIKRKFLMQNKKTFHIKKTTLV